LKSSLRDLFEGKPTRTAGAKRRGAGSGAAARRGLGWGMPNRWLTSGSLITSSIPPLVGVTGYRARGTAGARSRALRYSFLYSLQEVGVGRPDGARIWARVLSELAQVPVVVEWERPAWRVRWQDGPTLEVLRDRAAALSRYRVASALPFEQLRFTRSDSRLALALGWLAQGSPGSPAMARDAVADVEAFCAKTGYRRSHNSR
jgi:hypothetical protein